MSELYTYSTPRPFGQFAMPAPAQNTCMREYAKSIGFKYRLSVLELMYDNCFAQLFRLINEMPIDGNFCCYSALMFPIIDEHKINKLIDLLVTKKIKSHFLLEKIVTDDYFLIQEYLKSNKFSSLINGENLTNLELLFKK